MASLYTRLADTLGISETEARTRLKDLGEKLRAAAQEEGAVRLPGLGIFQMRDDTLTFEPAEQLARTVNKKYAGLTAEPIRPITSDTRALPSVTATLPLSVATLDAPVSPTSARLEAGDSPVPPEVWTGYPSSTKTAPDREAAPSKSPAPFERQRRIFRIAAASVTLLFLIGASWFVLGQGGLIPTPESVIAQLGGGPSNRAGKASSTASTRSNDTAATGSSPSDSLTTTSQKASGPAGAEGTDTSEAVTSAAPSDEPPRWTLVVGSQADRASAVQLANRYRNRFTDLPVAVRASNMGSGTRYRVTVGGFESRDSALTALRENQARLPEGAWLLERP